ncbi:hypothetical protein MTDSW087_01163 [Methylobacterium dankookense]|uniref:Uncharacterized protein n=1 Tax=Methylobacterium dankookense TaxID=560405 RepID=A0A564FVN3_9HYPH|nr:hypothetical protein IFDJLNFL_3464 [Methylobacterium dankookense]VUF11481.1 hypothetical protein MTDSW087_01163 [Methylobacterium dankookense]
MNGERLSEVSRLADVLADQVLRESMIGETSMSKLTALGKAALLLQDYDQPVPDLVVDVLTRATHGDDEGEDGATSGARAAADGAHDGQDPFDVSDLGMGDDSEGRDSRPRLLPRLMQSLRLPRS